jgi:UDP-glucuronate 4-epimerase
MKILVTGGAGFIGSHACEQLLAEGHSVVALDNFDSYYSPKQKRRNIAVALQHPNYKLVEGDFGDRIAVSEVLQKENFDAVLHLAAQAGVRPSIEDPLKYERANVGNLIAFMEALRQYGPRKIVAASSSSVYGNSTPVPFREDAPCMQPISPYGATKRAGEIFLGTYSALWDFKIIVVRPFTVYGPRQRPDMAIAAFAQKILTGEPITLFGDGSTARDYTYVSDLVAGLIGALNTFPVNYGIYNLGGESPISLSDLVAKIENATGKKAVIERMAMQPGDVTRTFADISKARKDFGFAPKVTLDEGLEKTVEWVKTQLQLTGAAQK